MENSSPVCYATNDDLRPEYKTIVNPDRDTLHNIAIKVNRGTLIMSRFKLGKRIRRLVSRGKGNS